MIYTAVVDQESPEGAYGAYFPDLPGCFSAGDDPDHLLRMAREAVALHLEDVAEADLPTPRALAEIIAEVATERPGESYSFISVPFIRESTRPSRINVSIDSGLLRAIDAAAAQSGQTRSAFLTSSAIERILQG